MTAEEIRLRIAQGEDSRDSADEISALSRCAITESVQGVSRMTMMDRRGEGVPIILEEG